jgi:hypothetical protein
MGKTSNAKSAKARAPQASKLGHQGTPAITGFLIQHKSTDNGALGQQTGEHKGASPPPKVYPKPRRAGKEIASPPSQAGKEIASAQGLTMSPATSLKRKTTEIEHGEQVKMRQLLLDFWDKTFSPKDCIESDSNMSVDHHDVLRVKGCCTGATAPQLQSYSQNCSIDEVVELLMEELGLLDAERAANK